MGIPVLYLVKYHNEQKAAMVARAEMRDRAEVHRKAIADFGGKPIAQFGRLGETSQAKIKVSMKKPEAKSKGGRKRKMERAGSEK